MSSQYGKIAIHNGKMCLATKHIDGDYGGYYENKILLYPYFVKLNGVPVLRWLEALDEGSVANDFSWHWEYDYSDSAVFNYEPPTDSGVETGGEVSFYAISNVVLSPSGGTSWNQFVVTPLVPITKDAGWTFATYETDGTNTTSMILSNPTIIGISNIAFKKFRYRDGYSRFTRIIKAGVSLDESVDSSITEPGVYHLYVRCYIKVNFSTSSENRGTYHLVRSDNPESWPQTLEEGKRRSHYGYFIQPTGAKIKITVARNDDGRLYISDFDEYFEVETSQFSKSAETGFAGNIDIPAGFKARCKTTDLFAISI